MSEKAPRVSGKFKKPKKGERPISQIPLSNLPQKPKKAEIDREPEDITPEKNGGVLKLVKKDGVGNDFPMPGDKVFVHYKTFLEATGRKIESSREKDEEMSFVLGANEVVGAWEMVILTMRLKEKCEVFCEAPYAYGAEGRPPRVPPNAGLIYEIELLRWEGEDISPEKDGSINRSIRTKGEGNTRPKDGSLVKGHVIAYYDRRAIIDTPFEHELGEGEREGLPSGVDAALKRFRRGDRAIVQLKSKWAFGKAGSESLRVPPYSPIQMELTLTDFEQKKSLLQMNEVEKLREAEVLWQKGAELVREEHYKSAMSKYNRIVVLMSGAEKFVGKQKKEKRKTLVVAAHLNLALCQLKLKDASRVIEHCEQVLLEDKRNLKAFYRRAQAYEMQKDYHLAILDYGRVVDLDPTNKAAEQRVQICEKYLLVRKTRRELRIYSNMFGPWGFNEFKPPENWKAEDDDDGTAEEQKAHPTASIEELEMPELEGSGDEKITELRLQEKKLGRFEVECTKHY